MYWGLTCYTHVRVQAIPLVYPFFFGGGGCSTATVTAKSCKTLLTGAEQDVFFSAGTDLGEGRGGGGLL